MSTRTALPAYRTTVGRKILMAVTGAILVAFVIGHMIGNLKVYQGAVAFNHYAEGLRTFGEPFFGRGQVLWLVRLALLAALLVHVGAATQLWLRSRRARSVRYEHFDPEVFSVASRTMAWGGVLILFFVIYHLLHLTFGTVHPQFVPHNAYNNFVVAFRSWPVSLAYMAAMIPLGLHLYHGIWSGFQTLGVNDDRGRRWRRPLALAVAWIVVIGNVSFPLAVLTGMVR